MTDALRQTIRDHVLADEAQLLRDLLVMADLDSDDRAAISARAAALVRDIRSGGASSLMEVFLEEYGLSTKEGVALMCLAEALLRVPDAETIDALIEDKIAPSDWGLHLGKSSSPLVNASTWALMLTGKVLDDEPPGLVGALRGALKRVGEPVIRSAVSRAMREMGRQFVLGRTISEAMTRAAGMEAKGYTYSYDMLGEAARTDADARRYHLSYSEAITAIARNATHGDVRANPGISVKLSALHPRYEYAQRDVVMRDLVPRVRSLALLAKSAGMGFNIDAEEADRLDLSLDIIEALLSDPALAGWDGFGVVVQAYSRRAGPVIDWLYQLAKTRDRRIMLRLVKGAYWDTEIKRAQVLGLPGFPVFTRKQATDVSYIACARKLMAMTDHIYPQFATHNAHTVAAILHMGADRASFEFQRLHGMGEAMHDLELARENTHCRIYAPVGAHRDLLAYLVRRLLENGANSSFVHQIVDPDISPEEIATDPFDATEATLPDNAHNPRITLPRDLFGTRANARGWDITDPAVVEPLLAARDAFAESQWHAAPRLAVEAAPPGTAQPVTNPATGQPVGTCRDATALDADAARAAARPWDASDRAAILNRAADLYEENAAELFALLAREAGKTLLDAVGELREAVDFLRYYAAQSAALTRPARGVVTAISPWNFPLAIFTGQIAAALAAGNAVLAKPAEATPLVAARAVDLLLQAGVPQSALQLLPGPGQVIGQALVSHADLTAFTGSTATAQAIHRSMAGTAQPWAPLIAETGGLNAMIVDSTALPEQAVRDILASAFQSAGQRCSALRLLYVQKDVAETIREMLFGAMDALRLGDPWDLTTDVGPIIDQPARDAIAAYVDAARIEGRVLKEMAVPMGGSFIGPTVISVNGIADLEREVFGPVLHLATFEPEEIPAIIAAINGAGYGLTFGLHTRIDDRVADVTSALKVGNAYVNRNQIGAVVGSQPFGGEGLSGTGPKAGGPAYLPRFTALPVQTQDCETVDDADIAARWAALPDADGAPRDIVDLPGPTGESNRLSTHARGRVLCLGAQADAHAEVARSHGCPALAVAGAVDPALLESLPGLSLVVFDGSEETARTYRQALAARSGPIVALVPGSDDAGWFVHERHLCIDTTASGGNTDLLAAAG